VPSGVSAAQVVLVDSSGSSATVRACRRADGRYLLDRGPYQGHVGRNGVSWSKREGDLRTPAGTFPLRGGFGAKGDPGLATGWFTVDGNDVWVDDSGSSLYNTHQRKPVNGRWDSAENLLNTPAYRYVQVVGYNESRTPGKGSAIFFHVDTGGGTAGCVSLPTAALLEVLRWERPGAVMSIR
jgi:L,D-peptidoglycan transpeptidase YkuD (ErfK/YbiS/YcfS/YnhG family)